MSDIIYYVAAIFIVWIMWKILCALWHFIIGDSNKATKNSLYWPPVMRNIDDKKGWNCPECSIHHNRDCVVYAGYTGSATRWKCSITGKVFV